MIEMKDFHNIYNIEYSNGNKTQPIGMMHACDSQWKGLNFSEPVSLSVSYWRVKTRDATPETLETDLTIPSIKLSKS